MTTYVMLAVLNDEQSISLMNISAEDWDQAIAIGSVWLETYDHDYVQAVVVPNDSNQWDKVDTRLIRDYVLELAPPETHLI